MGLQNLREWDASQKFNRPYKQLADHGEPEVKENAAKSLSILIELGDEFVIGVLMQLASTATWRDVGRKAVKALGDVAEKTDKAIDALQNLSQGSSNPIISGAAETILAKRKSGIAQDSARSRIEKRGLNRKNIQTPTGKKVQA